MTFPPPPPRDFFPYSKKPNFPVAPYMTPPCIKCHCHEHHHHLFVDRHGKLQMVCRRCQLACFCEDE